MRKKLLAFILSFIMVFSMAVPVSASQEGRFAFVAATANGIIIEPVYIKYTSGQTIQDALLSSGYMFTGLEQGFIYEINGVEANYSLFYDNNGHDLSQNADKIKAMCIGVTSKYSNELLNLIDRMAQLDEMGNAKQYPEVAEAYQTALTAIRNGDSKQAVSALEQLNKGIDSYNAVLGGTKYNITVAATQGGKNLTSPVVTMTDGYGNETKVTGTSVRVVPGEYSFSVSDGGYNRSEGSITISADTKLSVEIPSGDWFGEVKILDGNKNPYPYTQNKGTHTAAYRIPDTAKELSSLYLYVEQGTGIPDSEKTKLFTKYTGVEGTDYSSYNKSWESTQTVLANLVSPGMKGVNFDLEAQYIQNKGNLTYTQIQSYAMSITRTPTLSALTLTGDGTVLPLIFDPVTYNYQVVTVSDKLLIDAVPFGKEYTVTGTGTADSGKNQTIKVEANGVSTTYTIQVTKKSGVHVTLTVPTGVTAQVYNKADNLIAPVNGVYSLIPGEEYYYIATKNNYYHTKASFTASEGLKVAVASPTAEDWISAIALYNGSNTNTRVEYKVDNTFTSADHDYLYTVSDCNTTAYIQATSKYTVTANYVSQTTAVSTHGIAKNITVNKTVSSTGAATALSQLVAKSGYSNTVTLRVSQVSNNVTYYQDYVLTVARKLHLISMNLSSQNDELTLFDYNDNKIDFDRDVTDYKTILNRDIETIHLNGTFPNELSDTSCCGGYYAMVNGIRYTSLRNVEIPLNVDKSEETIKIQICHEDTNSIATEYQIKLEKTDPVRVTFKTTPQDAIVYLLNDLNGKRIIGKDGVYSLTPGGSYSYMITRDGYVGQRGTYQAPSADGTMSVTLAKAQTNSSIKQLSSYWPHLRQNDENNGVISAPTPVKDDEAVLYWATQIGDGYDSNACGCPILVDGYLYTYAGTTVYKVDTVSGEIVATGQMDHSSSFAINPPTYAEGMIFIGLADGTVQAFNASTLESLWIYRDPLKGQPNCSITYHNGYIYTGFWIGETSEANFVCISITDENPSQKKEEKLATWRYTSKGGFYWAGAYICDDYLLVGTDDGASGYLTGKARLLSFDPLSGVVLDEKIMNVNGDIRSSITSYNGKYYFTNKGGYFFEASVTDEGKISDIRTLKLYNYSSNEGAPPMSTCTPTIYNGRAYIGVSGTNQFGAYSGHNITVIDINNWERAYSVRTQGYPQTSGILTTYYEDITGEVYVYFFDNYTPGKLRVLKDKPGQTKATLVTTESYTNKGTTKKYDTAYVLFTPEGEQAEYAICSPIVDEYGTIYFKNDSSYLMALGSTVKSLEVTKMPKKISYQEGDFFKSEGMEITAVYSNGIRRDVTDYVTWSKESLTKNDTDFEISLPYIMYQNKNNSTGVDYPEPFVVLSLTVDGSTVKSGDVDNDGNINVNDVVLILKYVNGTGVELTSVQIKAADVDKDGNVNVNDVVSVLQQINGSK